MALQSGNDEMKDEKKANEDDSIVIHSLPLRIFYGDLARFICEQCGRVPIQMASCNDGHSFCKPCITKLCETNGVCPSDQKPIIKPHFPIPFLNNMISKEKICCLYGSVKSHDNDEGGNGTNKGDKCHWEGLVSQLFHHLKDCKFKPIQCRFHEIGCNQQLLETKIKSHYEDFNVAHQDLILTQIKQIKTEMKDLRSIVITLGDNIQQQINGIKQTIEKYHEEKKEERSVIIAVGCNEKGELGRGDDDDCKTFQELKWSNNINISQIISCSYKACCFITDTKDVYISGDNGDGQLGIDSEEDEWSAKLHPFFKFKNLNVIGVSRSIIAKHIFFICDNNDLYCSGGNEKGQLGMDHDENYIIPKLNKYFCSNNIIISKIVCGEYHSVFLSKSGAVYSCGLNKSNQLGYKTVENKCQKIPQRIISLPDEIVDIAAGRDHSYCVDINGCVWSFGSNDNGQLGINDRDYKENDDEEIIHKIKFFENNGIFIVKVSSGNYHGVVLDKNGNVFVWGKGNDGQIGNGKTEDAFAPIKLDTLHNILIVDIFCGCNHTACLSKDNRIYCWGNNRFNQCCETVVDQYNVYETDQFVSTPNEYYKIGANNDKLVCMGAGSYNMLLLLHKN